METLPAVKEQVVLNYSIADIREIGEALAESRMFEHTKEQSVALCLIAHAEGQHPALAGMEYDIIKGTPSLKSKAMLARFQAAGGSVEWHQHDEEACEATFSHPVGGTLRIRWDMEMAKAADLSKKDNWRKYPRAMLRARCVSEGVSAVYPGAARLYTPEEVRDFAGDRFNNEPKNITSEVDVKPAGLPEDVTQDAASSGTTDPDQNVTAKLNAAREAAAERQGKEPPEADTTGAFPEPTGKKIPKDHRDKLLAAFKEHGVDQEHLEEWRGLKATKWTESVLQEMRDLFKQFKSGDIDAPGFIKYLEDTREG